jgi:hypothetical protein
MTIKPSTIILGIIMVALLAGCSLDRWSPVEPGRYVVASGQGRANAVAREEVQHVTVDRAQGRLVFGWVDGTQTSVAFVARARADWPAGCPTNIHSTRMEVLDIAQDALVIGSLTFDRPILVRTCPPEPVRLVLMEGGVLGGGRTACVAGDECVFFDSVGAAVLASTPLPQSVKGYELYSRQVNGRWHFTLVTGTDRLKDYEEITTGEDVMSEDGWVRLSADGVDGIKALLGRLPPGASVLWSGPERQERVGGPVENLQLPPQAIIAEIQSHSQKLGIELVIVE